MKSSKVKKVVLTVLLLILIYIWWGNIKNFSSETGYYQEIEQPGFKENKRQSMESQLTYKKVKVNPFQKPVYESQSETTKPTNPPVQLTVPLISSRALVVGIVAKGNQGQAVVQLSGNFSKVVSVGDSLNEWEVLEIQGSFITCRHEKQKDTLWLTGMDQDSR